MLKNEDYSCTINVIIICLSHLEGEKKEWFVTNASHASSLISLSLSLSFFITERTRGGVKLTDSHLRPLGWPVL